MARLTLHTNQTDQNEVVMNDVMNLERSFPAQTFRGLKNSPDNACPIFRSDLDHHGSQKSLYCVWADVHPAGDLFCTEILD